MALLCVPSRFDLPCCCSVVMVRWPFFPHSYQQHVAHAFPKRPIRRCVVACLSVVCLKPFLIHGMVCVFVWRLGWRRQMVEGWLVEHGTVRYGYTAVALYGCVLGLVVEWMFYANRITTTQGQWGQHANYGANVRVHKGEINCGREGFFCCCCVLVLEAFQRRPMLARGNTIAQTIDEVLQQFGFTFIFNFNSRAFISVLLLLFLYAFHWFIVWLLLLLYILFDIL